MTVNDYIKQIESIGNSRDLNALEQTLRDDPWIEGDPAYRPVFDALARQETVVKEREAAGNKAIRQDELRAMMDAVKSVSVMGSGIGVKKQGRGKTLRTPKGVGFSVPSGSSESLNAEGTNDALKAPLGQFLNEYVLGHMTGNYVDPHGKSGQPQVLTHDEVVNDLGIVPPDIGKSALEKLLADAAGEGAIGSGDVSDFGKQFGLPKAVQDRANVAIRKAEKAEAGPSTAKAQKEAVGKTVGKVAADARKQVTKAFTEATKREKRISFLQGKQEGKRETETKLGILPDAAPGAGGNAPITTGSDAPFDKEAHDAMRHTGEVAPPRPDDGPAPAASGGKKPKSPPMTLDGFQRARSAMISDVGDEYAKDPKRRGKIGTADFRRDVATRLRANGMFVDKDGRQDAKDQADGRADLDESMAALYKEEMLPAESYIGYLNNKGYDSSLPHGERRRAIRQVSNLEARESAKKSRGTKTEAAEKERLLELRHKLGFVPDDDMASHLNEQVQDKSLSPAEHLRAQHKLASFQAARQEREEKAEAQEEVDNDPTTKFKRERAEAVWDVSNEFLSDPKKRKLYGGAKHKKAEQEELKRRGLLTDADKAAGKKGSFDLYKGSLLVAEFTSAFRSGLQVGNAAGAVATGLTHAIVGAGSLFVHAGETALGLLLSPFGRTGGAAAHLAGGIGQAFLSALSAGGAVVTAGLKIGVGIASGVALGLSAGIGAGIGAIIGTIAGIGPLAGAVAGAGLVAGIGSAIVGLLSTVGGVIGQALGAIGTAFGQLGGSLGSFLSSVQSVLSDLIETGVKLSTTTLATQRGSGMSLGASSEVTALSQVLTGGPGAFSGTFQNMAMMTPYMKARDQAYGVKAGGSFVDNLPGLFQRYKAFGDGPAGAMERRIMLSVVAPGSEAAVGGLFSLGGGMVNKAVQTAKATALSPKEVMQNAVLGFNLDVVGAQLDRLKTKLLSDLMPAITTTLNVFSKWFTGHEGAIIGSLEHLGRWLYVMLPEYLRRGGNAFFELGKSIGSNLPQIVEFAKTLYTGFATVFNAIESGLGGLMKTVGALMVLVGEVLPGGAGKGLMASGMAMGVSGQKLLAAPGLDPNGLGKLLDKQLGKGDTWQKVGDRLGHAANEKEYSFDQSFQRNAGSEQTRSAAFDQYLKNSQPGAAGNNALTLKADITVHPDEDSFHRFEVRVGDKTIQRIVRADQRS